jgi:DNA-binding protein HU-beta
LLFLDLQGFWVAAGLMKPILCLAYRFESFQTIERGGNMNKNELVSAVAEKAGLTKADAASAVDAVFDVVQGELKKKGDVRLAGFGSFTVSHRAATKGRNPSTGAEVDIPARNVPKFTPGKGLKDAVNG